MMTRGECSIAIIECLGLISLFEIPRFAFSITVITAFLMSTIRYSGHPDLPLDPST